jgi:DNA repair exonuclease SbcCD ATPase subunit
MAQAHATQMDPLNPDPARKPNQRVLQTGGVNELTPQAFEAPLPDEGIGNLDKIREILFGSHARDYDSRFARLEERLTEELADLRDTAKKRLEALETYARSEFESLQAHLKGERDDRTNALRQIARDLRELGDALTAKISELDEKNSQADRQSRLDLLQLSKNLNEELRSKQEEMGALLDRRFQELRNVKMDRAGLATLFMELATRLNGGFQVPGTQT